jgi:AcrR family transcriptional regulator
MVVIMSTPSREKMISSTALLLREQGLTGTSFGDVIEHSGAPRGSIYHHFPDGKAELVQEAVRFAGHHVGQTIESAGDDAPVAVLRALVATWRATLESSDFRAGCPVVAVAVEADQTAELRAATAETFGEWQRMLASLLCHNGIPPTRAPRLASLTVAAIEGAVVICRAQRSTQALDEIADELEETLVEALGQG